ncbi:MAG: phosphoglycerate dehydrogenase [Deltaproteobacteria bacterium]|jgi:D-3-phosphoglycerate dehydrogenase|nr:phosphoglycerate dehydrogenase [Deltaproteobacteria bacterium]
MKVAVTTSSFARYGDEPLVLLRQNGVFCVYNESGRSLTEDEAIGLLQGCIGVIAGTERLSRRVLDACPDLRVISRCGTGMDGVDLEAAKEKGIAVRNSPDAPILAVAEITLSYALDMLRNVTRMDRELRAGTWKKRMGFLLEGKKVGIVGYGRIGRATAKLFAAFGARIAFADPVAEDAALPKMELDALCAWAHIISLHCPAPKDGGPVMSAERLARMWPGSWLINAARGGLVDEEALCRLLQSGHLAGAALDVFAREPYVGPLAELDNVILTPHIGSYAQESRVRQEVDTVKNLLEALRLCACGGKNPESGHGA